MDKKKVLIIEDEKVLADALNAHLKTAGFATTVAYDGKQAKELLKENNYDIALLDLIMPVIDGWQVLNDLFLKQVKTVIVSNLSGEDHITRAREMGVQDYIVKANTSLDELVKKVVELLKMKFEK